MSKDSLSQRNVNTQQKQIDNDAPIRPIPATKIANLKRKMKGAHRRVIRFGKEIEKMRGDISRKYFIKKDDDGLNEEHIPISPSEIVGLRDKRIMVEGELAEAKGELYVAEQAYRAATTRNLTLRRKANSKIRKANRTRREAGKLMRKTLGILQDHGANGGAKDVAELKSLAKTGDISGFRKVFDEKVREWAPEHYVTISGVSTVKTEILKEVMEQFKTDPPTTGTISDLNV